MHEAGGEELAHPGIDDGEAGEAVFPFSEILAGFVPGEVFPVFVELVAEDVGEVVEDGEVEFAPGEFLDVDGDGGCLGEFFDFVVKGAYGDEAVAEILGEAGGGFGGGEIAEAGVLADDGGEGVLHALAGGAFTGLREGGGGFFEAPPSDGGEVEGGDSAGGVERLWLWEWGCFFEGEPVAGVGGEDFVGGGGLGEDLGGVVEGDVVVAVAGDAEFLAESVEFLFGGFSEGVGVAVVMDGGGSGFEGEFFEFGDGMAFTDDEVSVDGGEVAGEGFEAAAEEVLAVGAGPVVLLFPGTQDVNGDDGEAVEGGVAEGGVIGDAEIAAEPVYDGGHGG